MIPLSLPHLAGNEWKYVKDCLDTGWVSSAGAYVTQFEEAVANFAGAKYGVACMNGTAALHLSMRLLGVEREDYVLVPNITFIASINAIKYLGAHPILIDVDPDSWQMDVGLLETFLQEQTTLMDDGSRVLREDNQKIAAIMPVHVLGNMCEMDHLMQLAKRYNLPIVEDATESLGSYYKGKHSGSFGNMGCFSFNGNKIITTGGGGVVVTDDEVLAKKAKHLTTQAKISPDEYIHDEVGYNYRLVNVLAAIGVAQMEQLPGIIAQKKKMDAYYRSELAGVGDIQFQEVAPEVDANCWLFTLRTERMRPLLQFLNEQEIQCRPFWMPMNQLPMFQNDYFYNIHNYSNQIYQSSISIPSSGGLTDQELETVVKEIRRFYKTS